MWLNKGRYEEGTRNDDWCHDAWGRRSFGRDVTVRGLRRCCGSARFFFFFDFFRRDRQGWSALWRRRIWMAKKGGFGEAEEEECANVFLYFYFWSN